MRSRSPHQTSPHPTRRDRSAAAVGEELLAQGELIAGLTAREHGFAHVRNVAQELWEWNAASEVRKLARRLYGEAAYQNRMCAVFLFGMLAEHDPEALVFLRDEVATDEHWRVQEILAQVFDHYCRRVGYEAALPVIKNWLTKANPNTRRAVIEGLRVWTKRPYFREHPDTAVGFIGKQRDHESEHLRRSVGNSLRDIKRTHPAVVSQAVAGWDRNNPRVAFVLGLIGDL